MGSVSDASKSSTPYSFIVRTVVLPFIDRFINGFLGKSCEVLNVSIPGIGFEKAYGGKKMTNNNEPPQGVSLTLENPVHFCWLLFLDPKLGLGEAYMAGDWNAQPGPTEFLKLLIRAKKESLQSSGPRKSRTLLQKVSATVGETIMRIVRSCWGLFNYTMHVIKANTLTQSAKNIRDHYDLGNDMFELFLDPSMTYSCGVFDNPGYAVEEFDAKTLQLAQIRKIDSLIDMLDLTPDDHVLEVGCGWGSCAIRAVQRYGCRWTGLTISREQLDWAADKINEAGLTHLIELKYLDYRLETGVYSKVISVEMVEAVGEKYLPEYFRVINHRLAPGGTAVLQAITCPDAYYDRYCRSSDFIRKHIFPGGHLPSLGHILQCLPHGLQMGKTVNRIGRHYATTLDHWMCAWIAREKEIVDLGYSETFHRKWQFYFALCSALFSHDHIDTIQFTLQKSDYQTSE